MNTNKITTKTAYILDRSGSMAPLTEDAIAGFNAFVAEQRDVNQRARLT